MVTDGKGGLQRTALERAKERIFTTYCQGGIWLDPRHSGPVRAILNSGILSGEKLKGPKKERYPVNSLDHPDNLGRLLFDLVKIYLDYSPDNTEILQLFDQYFEWMAEIAQLGGVQKRRLDGLHQEFREKISARLNEGKIDPHWQQILWAGKSPDSLPQEFAKIFLNYVPTAHDTHIVKWTNSILKALEKEPENENTLRIYVGRARKETSKGPIPVPDE